MKFTVTLDLKGTIMKEIDAANESEAREKFKHQLDMSEVLMECGSPTVTDTLRVVDAGQAAQAVFRAGKSY